MYGSNEIQPWSLSNELSPWRNTRIIAAVKVSARYSKYLANSQGQEESFSKLTVIEFAGRRWKNAGEPVAAGDKQFTLAHEI